MLKFRWKRICSPQQAAPIPCLVCDQENCRLGDSLPGLPLADGAGAPGRDGEACAANHRGDRRERRRQDRLPWHADGHSDAASRAAPYDGSRAAVDLVAADDGHGALHRLVPGKNRDNPEHWHWVHCQFHCRRRRQPIEVVFADVAGEAFAEETEREGRYPAIRALLVEMLRA